MVEGIVRDVASGQSVAGIRVVANTAGFAPSPSAAPPREFAGVTDREGRFRFRVTAPLVPVWMSRVDSPRWHLVHWQIEDAPADHWSRAEPGLVNRVVLWISSSFRLQGTVVDEQGHPLPDVEVEFPVA